MTLRDLSRKLTVKMEDLMTRLASLGEGQLSPDSLVDLDVAELIGLEMGRKVERSTRKDDLEEYRSREVRPDWPLRPPVVCVMGHVDHGKTTLLDALRKTKVAADEAGGITQRLGAFYLDGFDPNKPAAAAAAAERKSRKKKSKAAQSREPSSLGVTFLDTPGHAAFSSMRQSGALATDIVLLTVSATDGIQEQTKEILKLVQKEGMNLMVAVTKADKVAGEVDEAVSRIERELAAHGIMTEGLAGDVQIVPVSAVTGEGLDELRERLALQAEMMELRADPKGKGEAVVLDCYVDKGLGTVMSVLVRWGVLRPGEYVVVGEQFGKIKKIMDQDGKTMSEAMPSMPVKVLGLKDLPTPGQDLIVVPSEERARAVAEARREAAEALRMAEVEDVEVLGDDIKGQLQEMVAAAPNYSGRKTKAFLALQQASPDVKEGGLRGPIVVPFLLKADGKGLLDAITASLAAYESDIIRTEVMHAGVGAVTAGDLELAKSAGGNCSILAFGVGFANGEVGETARREKVPVFRQSVIYSLLDDVKAVLQENMPMDRIETPVGKLEVQATFELTGRRRTKNLVAGCRVVMGQALSAPSYRYRVTRNGEVVHDESSAASLYHFKEQVQEVTKGMECGLSLESFGDFQPGDVVECYTVTEKRRDLKQLFPF